MPAIRVERRAGYDSSSIVAFIPLFLGNIFLGIAGNS
jgi:hypothetical protein